jgi:hypothetical protein
MLIVLVVVAVAALLSPRCCRRVAVAALLLTKLNARQQTGREIGEARVVVVVTKAGATGMQSCNCGSLCPQTSFEWFSLEAQRFKYVCVCVCVVTAIAVCLDDAQFFKQSYYLKIMT